MPSIIINEDYQSTYREKEVDDNIVFIPGSAITGPKNVPTLLSNINDLYNTFGKFSVEGNLSWIYAANLLKQGLKVMYYRVTATGIASAKVTVSTPTDVDSVNLDQFEVIERYGGTFGNTLSLTIDSVSDYKVIKLYSNGILIETLPVSATKTDSNYIGIVSSKYVTFNILNSTNLEIPTVSTKLSLSGGTDSTESSISDEIKGSFASIVDKYKYDVKFIVSGGYTTTTTFSDITNAMLAAAETREDSFVITDIPFGVSKENALTYVTSINSSYGQAVAPWGLMTDSVTKSSVWMPPSYYYLSSLASMIKSYPIWYPVAGVKRSSLSQIEKTEYDVDTATLNEWQNNTSSINPIMELVNYGYCIYGQRTLQKASLINPNPLESVNVRITANEIKRYIWRACLGLEFDQNDTKLWNEFKGTIEPKLDSMKKDRGLYDYEIVMDDTTVSDTDQINRTVPGIVRVSITRTAENFDISFIISDTGVSFNSDSE